MAASLIIETSGWGGRKFAAWNSICSCKAFPPEAAATNPRKGGEGFNGRVQNSGCAWKPRKNG